MSTWLLAPLKMESLSIGDDHTMSPAIGGKIPTLGRFANSQIFTNHFKLLLRGDDECEPQEREIEVRH